MMDYLGTALLCWLSLCAGFAMGCIFKALHQQQDAMTATQLDLEWRAANPPEAFLNGRHPTDEEIKYWAQKWADASEHPAFWAQSDEEYERLSRMRES